MKLTDNEIRSVIAGAGVAADEYAPTSVLTGNEGGSADARQSGEILYICNTELLRIRKLVEGIRERLIAREADRERNELRGYIENEIKSEYGRISTLITRAEIGNIASREINRLKKLAWRTVHNNKTALTWEVYGLLTDETNRIKRNASRAEVGRDIRSVASDELKRVRAMANGLSARRDVESLAADELKRLAEAVSEAEKRYIGELRDEIEKMISSEQHRVMIIAEGTRYRQQREIIVRQYEQMRLYVAEQREIVLEHSKVIEELHAAEREDRVKRLEEYEREVQRQKYRKRGLCQHCGGEFKGLLTKKCSVCGQKKDY